jgi:hypothetical protein
MSKELDVRNVNEKNILIFRRIVFLQDPFIQIKVYFENALKYMEKTDKNSFGLEEGYTLFLSKKFNNFVYFHVPG